MRYRSPVIALVVTVLLGVGFFFLLWQPKTDEIELVRSETSELEAERGRLQNELARLQEIQEREVDYRAALARLEEYIPSGAAQAAAIRQFQLTADAAGVTIDSVAFSEPAAVVDAPPTGTADTVLASIGVSMNVEGGYFQVVDFYRRLEVDVPRAVLQQSISINEAADGFPVLNNAWTGALFTVIPDPDPVPEPDPDEAEVDGEGDVDVDADVDDTDGSGEDV